MATIGKSFSDPDKWEEPWFANLSPEKKLLFIYLWDRCDHAGVINITTPIWSAHTGLDIDGEMLESIIEEMNEENEQVVNLGRKIWFLHYIRFNQQPDPSRALSAKHPFHQHIFKRLQTRGLVDEVNRRDPILLSEFMNQGIDASIEESINPKPSLSHGKALPKPTGKGKGSSRGGGNGTGRGGGPPSAEGNKSKLKETILEFEMRNKGQLDDTPF